MVGPGNHQEKASSQPIPVDHDVQREEYGTQDIRQDFNCAGRVLVGIRGCQPHQVAGVHLAQQIRQGAGQVGSCQPLDQA